jgi:hypothetical protein
MIRNKIYFYLIPNNSKYKEKHIKNKENKYLIKYFIHN